MVLNNACSADGYVSFLTLACDVHNDLLVTCYAASIITILPHVYIAISLRCPYFIIIKQLDRKLSKNLTK